MGGIARVLLAAAALMLLYCSLPSGSTLIHRAAAPGAVVKDSADATQLFNGRRLQTAGQRGYHSRANAHSRANRHSNHSSYFRERVRANRHRARKEEPIPPAQNTTRTCLTDECIQATAQQLARAFPMQTNRSEWCLSRVAARRKGHRNSGLLLVRVPKAASSTTAAVALRIAKNHGCKPVDWNHNNGRTFKARAADSFLLASIRDPDSRSTSFINFRDVSLGGERHTDVSVVARLKNLTTNYGSVPNGQGGFTMQFASLEYVPKYSAWNPGAREFVQNPEGVHQRIQKMMQGYGFLLVVERMDESLVTLALLLGLDVGDVVVVSAKTGGSESYIYDERQHICRALTHSNATNSNAVQEYLASDDWRAQNYGDYLLHAAANQSLDLTIDRIGREKFQEAFTEYKRLQAKATEVCASKARFPCSPEGKPQRLQSRQNCYARDFGCGYKCIDNMLSGENAFT